MDATDAQDVVLTLAPLKALHKGLLTCRQVVASVTRFFRLPYVPVWP